MLEVFDSEFVKMLIHRSHIQIGVMAFVQAGKKITSYAYFEAERKRMGETWGEADRLAQDLDTWK